MRRREITIRIDTLVVDGGLDGAALARALGQRLAAHDVAGLGAEVARAVQTSVGAARAAQTPAGTTPAAATGKPPRGGAR